MISISLTLPSLPSSDHVAYVISTDTEEIEITVKEKIVTLAKILAEQKQELAKTLEKIEITKKEEKNGG